MPLTNIYVQRLWTLKFSNSRRYFQYVGQLDSPTSSHASVSPPIQSPEQFYISSRPLCGPTLSTEFHCSDFTRQPQRWNRDRPHLPYVYREFDDIETPTAVNLLKVSEGIYSYCPRYIEEIVAFLHPALQSAVAWEKRLVQLGLPLPSFPPPPGDQGRMMVGIQSRLKAARGTLKHVHAFLVDHLRFGYECRGYARWASRRYISHVTSGLDCPPPLFGVNEDQVGAVFRSSDCQPGFQPWEELQRDGVPVFCIEFGGVRADTTWDRRPKTLAEAAAIPAPPTVNIRTHCVDVRREYGTTRRPDLWFVHAEFPGVPKGVHDEYHLRARLATMKSRLQVITVDELKILTELYGPGPFAAGTAFHSRLLQIPSLSASVELLPPDLQPLPIWNRDSIDGTKGPNVYSLVKPVLKKVVSSRFYSFW